MGANNVVAAAMGSASNAMKVTNEQMNPEKISGILKQFEEENMKMDMKDEMSMCILLCSKKKFKLNNKIFLYLQQLKKVWMAFWTIQMMKANKT